MVQGVPVEFTDERAARMTNARCERPTTSGMSDDAITTAMPCAANSVMMR